MKPKRISPKHSRTCHRKLLALTLAIGTVSAQAAQPVSIVNGSFESPAQSDGAFNGTATGWSDFGGISDAGVWNPLATDFSAEAPDGQNVGYAFGGPTDGGLSQVLTGDLSTLIADASYALTVKVGNSLTYTYDGYKVQLLAGGTVLAETDDSPAPAADSFVTTSVNYTYNAGLHSALVGQPLEIRLLSKDLSGVNEGETEFDDVQLTVTLANPVADAGGPYTAFIGGSLLLNGSGSYPSDGATITTYEWELDGDDDFNDVTGVTPAAITQADLVNVYGMELGGNTIKLRVTDSAAKTSTVQTSVNILPATAVVYEPFNYTGTALNGASGSSELGLTGTWTSNTTPTLSGNLSFGPLVTRGAGIATTTGSNTFGGTRAVNASALAGNGLLTDGATLWFSLILGYNTGGNLTNSRLGFALANSQFNAANFKYWINDEGAQVGSGLGVTLGRFSGVNGKVVATQFRDDNAPVTSPTTGFNGNVFGTEPTSAFYTAGGQFGLIVGKITWGANDTIELYRANADLTLPATPFSTLTVSVDQTTYDTITWARGDAMLMDEIRFGASYEAVIETGSAWDLNGATAGAGGATPSGTWNTDSNWNLGADGTLAPIPWQDGGVATFSAGTDATGAYTITVDGTKDIGGLVVEDGTVTIAGGTGLRLTKDATVSVATGLSATISSPITEDAPGRQFAKAGGGTLILSGDNSGATSGMNLAAGVTQFESASAINGTARNVTIASGGTMMFGSGFGAGNIPTALLGRVTSPSSGAIAADNYDSTSFDFNTAGLTAASLGAVGNVNYTGTLTPNGTTYRLGGGGGTLTMVNALTGANAVVINGKVNLAANNDYTGTTTINANSTVTIQGTSTSSGVSLNTPNTNLILGNNASLGTGTLTVVNSFAGPGTLSAIGTVVTTNPVAANTDFNFGGTGALTIGPVTIIGNNRIITNNNTTGTSTIESITRDGTNNRSVTLSGNGNTSIGVMTLGTGTLTKNGTGTLTLTGANAYTGTTTVNDSGTLRVVSPGTIPAGTTTLNGTSILTGNGSIGGAVIVTATANVTPGNNGVGTLPIAGNLTVSAMAGSTGTLRFELGPIATSDKITAGGTLAVGTNVFGFNDFVFTDVGGLENGTYKLITSGAAISGTLDPNPGALTGTIGAGPATGTLQVSLGGTDIELVVSGVVGGDDYSTWATDNGIGGEPFNEDFDKDGISNGVEYGLGLSPTVSSQPPGVFSGNTITFTKGPDAIANADVSWIIETSTTLAPGSWTAEVTQPAGDSAATIAYAFTPGTPAKKFARLKMVQVP